MKHLFLIGLFFLPTLANADFSFLAVGDTGKANEGQFQVGRAMGAECARIRCQFATLLGDNFYDTGVESPTDPQFVNKFERPYEPVNVPFYIALGNHDYGAQANQWVKGDYQIAYAATHPKFILPSHYYKFEQDNALFIVLDTSRLFHNKDTQKQKDFVVKSLRENLKKWVIIIAHHPYISNGKHGNAGNYDGVPFPPYSGSIIKSLFDNEICAHADLVLAGHDHNLQTLRGSGRCSKPIFVVSGGGATAKDDLRGSNPALFQKAILGFTSIKVGESTIDIEQRNADNQLEHGHRIEKP
jgi:tartrate-resistant acid phosphatase type 5